MRAKRTSPGLLPGRRRAEPRQPGRRVTARAHDWRIILQKHKDGVVVSKSLNLGIDHQGDQFPLKPTNLRVSSCPWWLTDFCSPPIQPYFRVCSAILSAGFPKEASM